MDQAALDQAAMEQIALENTQLRQQLALLSAQVSQLQGQSAALTTTTHRAKCPVQAPEKFDGTLEQFPAFLAQSSLYISLRADDFPTDRHKVGFLLSLLSGAAARWASPLIIQQNPVLDNYAEFCSQLRAMYEDPVRALSASRKLRNLRQGRRPVSEYISDFRLLAQDLAWNEVALLDQFQEGLSSEVLDELARTECPATLPELCHLCLRIDGRLQQRKARRQAIPPTPPIPLAASPRPATGVEPMQLGGARPRLTAAEKDRRRREGLCLYCAGSGHRAALCPAKVKPAPVSGNGIGSAYGGQLGWAQLAAETQTTATMPINHLKVNVTLQFAQLPAREFSAMLDSGATTNFMDIDFAQEWGVPKRPVDPPMVVETIDGRPLRSGPVASATQPLLMKIGNHSEWLEFFLVSTPHSPLVLGLEWLRNHDPQVLWSQGTVEFTSPRCASHLTSTLAAGQPRTLDPQLPPRYQDFADVFDEREADQLPPHRSYDCPIDLVPGAKLPVGRVYSLSEPERSALKEFLDTNLRKGFVRPSTSPVAAPVLFVKKKSGELRLCCDYRRLNDITIKNRYPLPLISELLERLRHATIFTKLDLRGAYNLVRIRRGDEWKTAFRTCYGHFEYTVMPFGLSNAPGVFMRFMHDVFRDLLDQFLIIYLDDILIFSNSLEEHDQHVRMVLQRLRDHRLYAKLEKCQFAQKTIEFLGHQISAQGIAMEPGKVEALQSWQPPRRAKDVQRLLGFANYYRGFIPQFAEITAPLTNLLRKRSKFTWNGREQRAFEELKTAFTTGPILRHPDPLQPFVVETDASDVAIGAVLLQMDPKSGALCPCAYYSRKLAPAEQSYTIWDKELLAIKVAFEVWRHHLEGARHPVEVRTDHRNLEHLKTARSLNQRQIRWSLFFSRFNFKVTYIPRGQNQRADALSRKPEYERLEPAMPARTVIPTERFAATYASPDLLQRIRDQQQKDPFVKRRSHEMAQTSADQATPWTMNQEVLCFRGHYYVPPGDLRGEVLHLCHDNPTAGHFGFFKTLDLLSRDFWWPRVREDVKQYVASCPNCRRAKNITGKPAGLLKPLPTPGQPWETVSMDFITDLPSSQGATTILVVVDSFTKMAHFIACAGLPTAQETARLYVNHVFRLHGLAKGVISDRGTQFTARFWKALLSRLGVQSHLSSAYHPESDGGTERVNSILEQYLRCYVNYQQDNWATLLSVAEFAYNNSLHSSTRMSPFMANYGFHPRQFPLESPESSVPAANQFFQELQATHRVLRDQLEKAKEDYKRFADRHRKEGPSLAVGDRVWLSTKHLNSNRPSRKLDHRFLGPFPIEAIINPVAFRLTLPPHIRVHPVFHRSLLVPVSEDSPLRPAKPPPPPIIVQGEAEYEVARILDSRIRHGRLQYLIDWKGYGPDEYSWEFAEDVHAPLRVRQFHRAYPRKPKPQNQREAGPEGGDSVRVEDPPDSEGEGLPPNNTAVSKEKDLPKYGNPQEELGLLQDMGKLQGRETTPGSLPLFGHFQEEVSPPPICARERRRLKRASQLAEARQRREKSKIKGCAAPEPIAGDNPPKDDVGTRWDERRTSSLLPAPESHLTASSDRSERAEVPTLPPLEDAVLKPSSAPCLATNAACSHTLDEPSPTDSRIVAPSWSLPPAFPSSPDRCLAPCALEPSLNSSLRA